MMRYDITQLVKTKTIIQEKRIVTLTITKKIETESGLPRTVYVPNLKA